MEELRELEERLLQPEFRRDRDAVSSLLAEEFVEFGSSGRVFDRKQILDLLADEPQSRARMTEFRARALSPEIVLVTYRTERIGSAKTPGASLRSSIWTRRSGRWQIVFHQGTRTEEGTSNP